MKKIIIAAMIMSMGTILLFPVLAQEQVSKKVGITWYGDKSEMSLRVMKGYTERLKEKGAPIDNECKFNLPDEATTVELYNKFMKEKDAVIICRSVGAKFLKKFPPSIPAFFGAANDPVALGAMTDSSKPELFTGVTYAIPAIDQLKIFVRIFPKAKNIAFIFDPKHPSGPIELEQTRSACKELGLTLVEAPASTVPDMLKSVKEIVSTVDFLVIGNQANVMDNAEKLKLIIGKTPLLSYAERPIKSKAALCGMVADDIKLGRILADMVISVLIDGKKIGEVPVATDPAPRFVVNMSMVKELGVVIPEEIMAEAEKVE